MVDVVSKTLRGQRQHERLQQVQVGRPQTPGVRVLPANEALRKKLKHPNGMAFRPEGSVEWPNDRFTKRRLAEGAITLEQPAEAQPAQQQPPEQEPKPAA